GLQHPNGCQGNITDVECCILRTCNVPEGSGFCRDLATQTCDHGKFFAGESSNKPCPGPNNIQCCVKYRDIVKHRDMDMANNRTSSTSSTSSSQTPTADLNPPTESSAPNLTDSQKGIIGLGGVVAAVVLFTLVFQISILYRKWRRKRSKPPDIANDDGDFMLQGLPLGKETHMIDGHEKRELDANDTRYEIGNQVEDSRNEPPVPDTGPTKPTGPVELPGLPELPELPGSVKHP
ncbi:hypothetical protein V8E54_010332, partial [Elaphomyces granulatus]